MANKNGNNNGGPRSPEEGICECVKAVKSERDLAQSLKEASQTTINSNKEVRKYKICCLDKASETNQTYLDIDYCVAYQQSLKTDIIKKNIDEYIKKDSDLEKLIKESSKMLSDLKTKIEEAHNASCAMKNCLNNKLFPKGDTPKGELSPELRAVEECCTEITEVTSKLNNYGQNAFEAVVTIAGIQTFSNIESLKDFGTTLCDAMKAFKDCIDANITSTGEDVKSAKADLTKVLEDLTNSRADKNAECVKTSGLGSMLEFVCRGECEDKSIEELCKRLEEDPSEEYPKHHHSHTKVHSSTNKD